MAKFRAKKQELERLLSPPAWPENAGAVPENALAVAGRESVSPLIALLPRGGILMWRAAMILGTAVTRLAAKNMEDARVVMRRLTWHLNEDSGNMGWGAAQAFGEILAQCPPLAAEYGRIALSYARDTGFADNYIEHGPLRQGAYWAIGRFAPLYAGYADEGKELLINGLQDEDAVCRGVSAWGVGKFAEKGLVRDEEKKSLTALLVRETENREECEILDGPTVYSRPASAFALRTLSLLGQSSSA